MGPPDRRYARKVSSREQRPTRVRARLCLASITLAIALAALFAPCAVAASLGGGNAFSELTKSQPEATHSNTTSSTRTNGSSSEPSNSHTVILAATGAAVLLLSGIAVVIVRDARRVAPAGDPESVERGLARDSAARLRKRRAKAKAARQQRKRNR